MGASLPCKHPINCTTGNSSWPGWVRSHQDTSNTNRRFSTETSTSIPSVSTKIAAIGSRSTLRGVSAKARNGRRQRRPSTSTIQIMGLWNEERDKRKERLAFYCPSLSSFSHIGGRFAYIWYRKYVENNLIFLREARHFTAWLHSSLHMYSWSLYF